MCDTLVVVESDRVLFAKNSDRDPNEAQFLDWQPRHVHAPGARLRCAWIEIPQVRETHAVLLSRPFWMWGAEMGANQHGVVVGNEAVFTREPYAKIGLTGMDLVRLALERAADAQQAVDVIVHLLAEFGQGGGCGHENRSFTYHNSFLIADSRGAFVLETAGQHHAVQAVHGARSISNGLTIADFADQYSDSLRSYVAGCRLRQQRTQAAAALATTPGDLMAILRDHAASDDNGATSPEPRYSSLNGGLNAPCVHAGGLVASSQTTASWVAELRPGECHHWATGTAAPCLSLFKPVRVEEPLDLGPRPADRYDPRTLWWRHEVLHRAVMRDPARLSEYFLAERDAQQSAWLTSPTEPVEAFSQADHLLSQWTERVAADPGERDTRPWYVRRYWSKRNARAGMPHTTTEAVAHGAGTQI